METVEVVIRLPEKTYRKILSKEYDYGDMNVIIQAGTVLPKGHGKLCDLDAALKCVNDDSIENCDAKWQAIGLFEWAMEKRVVIEADMTESEDKG